MKKAIQLVKLAVISTSFLVKAQLDDLLRMMYEWFDRFKNGDKSSEDTPGRGRSSPVGCCG